jgi:hypothetical protein
MLGREAQFGGWRREITPDSAAGRWRLGGSIKAAAAASNIREESRAALQPREQLTR